ncbi:hypothetical protein [Halalkalicoccus salilacus]
MAAIETHLTSLHANDPRQYALLEKHAIELRDILEGTEANSISAKHLYAI